MGAGGRLGLIKTLAGVAVVDGMMIVTTTITVVTATLTLGSRSRDGDDRDDDAPVRY